MSLRDDVTAWYEPMETPAGEIWVNRITCPAIHGPCLPAEHNAMPRNYDFRGVLGDAIGQQGETTK